MKFCFKDYRLLSNQENKAVLKIRNSQAVRDASIISEPIALKDHQKWVKSLLSATLISSLLLPKICKNHPY
ncbi:hypothetical protein [uncultured Campylobacter sp.]|uniref:hypothetical protein n=1 Tax=uncultured Campylobacter sp. TaxID=218934 RepID=UPI00262D6A14|nr:hypothetical protein [uncultured Campylobacter sp.]